MSTARKHLSRAEIARLPLQRRRVRVPLFTALFLHSGLAAGLALDALFPGAEPRPPLPTTGLEIAQVLDEPEVEAADPAPPQPVVEEPRDEPPPIPEQREPSEDDPAESIPEQVVRATPQDISPTEKHVPFQRRIFSNLPGTRLPEEPEAAPPAPVSKTEPVAAPPSPQRSRPPPGVLAAARPLAGHNPPPPYRVGERLYDPRRDRVVVARVHVDVAGKPTQVDIVTSCGRKGLDARVRSTILRRWRFTPATRAGRPEPSTVTRRFVFRPAR